MSLWSGDEQAVQRVAKEAGKVCWGIVECLCNYIGEEHEEASGEGLCGERGCFEEQAVLIEHLSEIGKEAGIG